MRYYLQLKVQIVNYIFFCVTIKNMNNINLNLNEIMQKNVKHRLNILKYGKFNLLYLNINSLKYKINELESMLPHNKVIHFIALTEIKIQKRENKYYNIKNYKSYFSNRSDGYGGTALFVHSIFSGVSVFDECTNNVNLLTVKIIELKLNISVIYKKPTVNTQIFNDIMNNFLEKIGRGIIVGDFNINILLNSNISTKYINILNQNGFAILNKVCINHATRTENKNRNNEITNGSNSIIDHIASNIFEYDYCISILNTELSDHKQILLSFDNKNNNTFGYVNSNTCTSVKKINKIAFRNQLLEALPQCNNDITHAISIINRIKQNSMVTFNYDRVTNNNKPWFNEKLLNLITERDRYAKLLKKNPDNCYLNQCRKNYSRRVIILRNILIKNYNSRQINRTIRNQKQLWQTLNQIIYNKVRNQ